jgi:hypothetical protein
VAVVREGGEGGRCTWSCLEERLAGHDCYGVVDGIGVLSLRRSDASVSFSSLLSCLVLNTGSFESSTLTVESVPHVLFFLNSCTTKRWAKSKAHGLYSNPHLRELKALHVLKAASRPLAGYVSPRKKAKAYILCHAGPSELRVPGVR